MYYVIHEGLIKSVVFKRRVRVHLHVCGCARDFVRVRVCLCVVGCGYSGILRCCYSSVTSCTMVAVVMFISKLEARFIMKRIVRAMELRNIKRYAHYTHFCFMIYEDYSVLSPLNLKCLIILKLYIVSWPYSRYT